MRDGEMFFCAAKLVRGRVVETFLTYAESVEFQIDTVSEIYCLGYEIGLVCAIRMRRLRTPELENARNVIRVHRFKATC